MYMLIQYLLSQVFSLKVIRQIFNIILIISNKISMYFKYNVEQISFGTYYIILNEFVGKV